MLRSLYDPDVERKGEIKGRRECIIAVLQERFTPSLDVMNSIKNILMPITDLDKISNLFKEAIICEDIESFMKKIK